MIRFLTFEQFHNKKHIGSTRIRVHNLIKYWREADLYRYGDKADVLIFQKVYMTYDYRLHEHYPFIKILDVCDTDWLNNVDVHIKETFDAVDAITCPTEVFAQYLRTFTDTPVRVIKDRFDLSEFPPLKKHAGETKKVVWYGYAHNAESIKFAVPSFEKRGLDLIIVSNEDPVCYRWANSPKTYIEKYKYIKFNHPDAYKQIQQADVCVLPIGFRPTDSFKSENKTIISQLLGVPVARDADELDALITAEARTKAISDIYDTIRKEYDCKKSVEEFKQLIKELSDGRN